MGRGRQRFENLPLWKQKPSSGGGEHNCTALGLEEAPVFYPTEEEFSDPLRFIAQIRVQSEPYGICRIVPPKSWNPPFAIESQSFVFPTKHQSIHQLQERTAACDAETFKLEYGRYLEGEGRKLEGWPLFEGEALDLCKLYNAVKRHGGYKKFRDESKWGEVFRMMKDDSPQAPVATDSALASLGQLYESHLYSYEIHQANVSAGKLLRMSKGQGMEVKHVKAKRGGRKRLVEDEQEEAQVGKRRRGMDEGDDAGDVVVVESVAVATFTETVVVQEQRADQICEQCHSGAHEKSMLLCDRCNRGWHLYCLSPPLSAIPHGNWYCLECLASENDSFGFAQGKDHSYESFQRFADRFKRKWFASRTTPPSNSDVETDFWRIVERATDPVEVLYGSDIDTGCYGSGFPRASDPVQHGCEPEAWDKYRTNPWNLNNFPKLEDSMLRMVQDDIPGVIVPWLYMGMLFSSFCWHYEDHCFYSINYLHRGAPKTWYSVPGNAASAFEEVMQKAFPDLFEAQPDLLFQLVTMLNPTVLRDSNVPVCTTTQETGNFVITFPRSYHGGFNHGFNCAEAVNFAPADWLPFGCFAVERYRFYHKRAVLSHDELLCVVAKNKVSPVSKPYVLKELVAIIKKERAQREQLWINGVVKSSRMPPRACDKEISTEEDPMCIICRYYLHLSAVVCSCRPSKAVCLQHARQLCECPVDQQRLLYRHSLAELDDLLFEAKENSVDSKVGDLAAEFEPTKRNLRRGAPSLSLSVSKKVMGRMVRHTDLAEKWLDKVQKSSHSTPSIEFLETVLQDVEQFLWAGHEMDSLRTVERKLSAARRWAEEVAKCSISVMEKRHPKVYFGVVQRLVGADPVPCLEPHLPSLKVTFESAIPMRQKIMTFTLTEPSKQRASLEALIEETKMFPLEFEELSGLQGLINSAKAWSETVRKLLPPIKALRSQGLVSCDQLLSLQHQGLALPVKQEDKEILDLVVLKAEALEQKVRSTLVSPLPLQEIEKVVQEAQELPLHIPGLQELELLLADARAWLLRVRSTLGYVHLYDYSTSVTMLTDLLEAASKLGAQLEDVKTVESALKKLRWLDSAAKVLEELPSTNKLRELLNEASRLELSNDKLVLQMQELALAALSWENKAAHVLKFGDSFANVHELLGSAENIKAKLQGSSALKDLYSVARSWKEQAQAYLNMKMKPKDAAESSWPLSTLQALVGDSEKLVLYVEESSLLSTCLADAHAWMSKVAGLMPILRTALVFPDESDSLHIQDAESLQVLLRQLEEQMTNLKRVLDEGLEFGLDLPSIAELRILFNLNEWSVRALYLLQKRPHLEATKCLLNEGLSFSIKTKSCSILQQAIYRAESWKKKVLMVVPLYGIARSCSRHELEQLLFEAKALLVSYANEESYLQDALTFHSLWQKQVHQALTTSGGCLTRQELLGLQEDSVASWVESDEKQQISQVLSDVDMWLSTCRDAIAAPTTDPSCPLVDMLSRMHLSVVRALQRVEGEELNCVCGEMLHKADASMLHCDTCDDWYHPTCLGLSHLQTRIQKQYICPYCSALSNGVLSLNEDAYKEVHVTQRPSSSVIIELLKSSRSIPCRMEEVVIMENLMATLQDWRELLSCILEPALVLRSHNTVVDVCSLLRALKAVEGMEVNEESSAKVMLAIKTNAWRNRAMISLDGAVKPSLRCISKSIKEAVAVSVTDDDCILQDLKLQEFYALHWIISAKQVIGDGGRAPLEEVCSLIEEGERLSVSVSKELSALRTRRELYCICRKPYDDDQSMISCDNCGEWYHFSCVGLPEPALEGSDERCVVHQDAAEFVCPDCEQAQHKRVRDRATDMLPPFQSKEPQIFDSRNPFHPLDENNYISCLNRANHCAPDTLQAPVTPEAPKEMEVPQAGLRGKRSSRAKTKAIVQPKWQQSHVLTSNDNTSSSSEAETPTSGRPCRRTAGRHSGFDNYVLLMRSR